MTRIVYWNISKFGTNKIADPKHPLSSVARRNLIRSVITAAQPDILVVGEVSARRSYPPGMLTSGAGLDVCTTLLAWLRGIAGDWRLVPPLVVGRIGSAEAVAIFYRGMIGAAGTRIFTGPYWSSGTIPAYSSPPGAGVPAPGNAYVGAAAALLVPSRTVPAGGLFNPGAEENRLAACIDFHMAPAAGMAGWTIDFINRRQPYMCTFCETDAAGAVRNLTLIAVHPPPGAPDAILATLAASQEIQRALGANEIRIVLGDFNMPLLNADGTPANPYGLPATFVPALRMQGPVPANHLDSYKGYATTHIKQPWRWNPVENKWDQTANFFSAIGTTREYPGLGYFGAAGFQNFYSIDNILVEQAAAPAAGYPSTVANTVVGTPYTDPFGRAVANNLPLGVINFARHFINPPPILAAPFTNFPWGAALEGTAPGFALGLNSNLISSPNYAHIYDTSDHFAVCADV
ncbi:hypothetical protein J2X19_001764 [Rhodoferax ferrireducens]|uniref:Endonuclease/exonuclease/phosphatase domain-containing protein n=1 Tax=Rhodoferax ferrireducens TaxID=192843 RepID=A0ABU2C6Z8_9BURK|nr:endonuclease/exonuclease/phosphatase family protein [Rhodoferax ferrireducens]MDR7377106.1 hypothetical protein [Rhodoferax ferrireducens]